MLIVLPMFDSFRHFTKSISVCITNILNLLPLVKASTGKISESFWKTCLILLLIAHLFDKNIGKFLKKRDQKGQIGLAH